MKTIPLYFEDTACFRAQATIHATGRDERGSFIVLDRTIFYPQGGGQPCDVGTIEGAEIKAVRSVEDEIRHYLAQDSSFLPDQTVELAIDGQRRLVNSEYHSAGHLLSHIVEKHYPHLKGIKGHHYLDGAYVEFAMEGQNPVDLILINEEIVKAIESEYEIRSWIESNRRYVQIGPFAPYACGGTHVRSLKELAKAIATKQKQNQGNLRISYEL